MAEVIWTARAREDLRSVHDFVARDSPRAAEQLIERLLDATDRLALFPMSGRVLPEFPDLGYRELIVSGYRVIHRNGDDTVWVVAVVHARRQLAEQDLR